ncbi:MAG: tRNA lysidine(34) synthetase TilS [Candidatus Rokuibacteriota bacterium]|nr:MAG: tRNA lysidine(34) synthetase TilS [Candidatus Rokubacteria bacterium]
MGLTHAVERTLRRHAMLAGGETVLVSVSGGADSVALLHLLHALAPSWRLTLHVLHVDHGLRPDSAHDAAVVRALGARLGLPAHVERVHVGPGSVEAAARAARYTALEAWAERVGADRIALGHTLDDQAETVLMRVLDGAGVRGLAAIPPVRGRIIRPLVEIRREALREMLTADAIAWVEDPSNRDPKFLRNRIRHELLPLLAASFATDVVPALARVARLARESVEALDRAATLELERLITVEEGKRGTLPGCPCPTEGRRGTLPGCPCPAITLPRGALAALPSSLAAEVLRQAAARLGSRAPLRAWAHRGLRRVLAPAPPRRPFRLGGVRVEVSGDRIRVGTQPAPALPPRTLTVPGRVALPEIGRALEARLLPAAGYVLPRSADCVAFDAAGCPRSLLVRGRRRGDRFVAFGAGERRLKSLLIDAGVPRWDRNRLPLVEAGGEILWVAGVRRAAAAPITAATQEVLEIRLVPSDVNALA